MPQRGRRQGRRRHRPHPADPWSRGVRGRLSAQGVDLGRERAARLQRRAASAPPADIPPGPAPPRWPIRPAEPPYQSRVLPDYQVGSPQPRRDIAPDEPVSLNPPGVADQPGAAAEPYDFRRPYGVTPAAPPPKYRTPPPVASPPDDFSPDP